MKTLTMIARHGVSKDQISAYTLITDDYQTLTISANDLAKQIKEKTINVINMTVGEKGLESTNGALNRYTFINNTTGKVEGVARAVILNRVEKDNKLVGFTVFTQTGTIAELNVKDASTLAHNGLVSNGKIRATQHGDIVSSISGNYPLRTLEMHKAPKGVISVDILYFAKAMDTDAEYVGAIISCTSATEMAKLSDMVNKSNAQIASKVVKVGGQGQRASLTVTRMGANSVYGVFGIDLLTKILGVANTKVYNDLGAIIVSALKYTDTDGNIDECKLSLGHDWKISADDTDTESEAYETLKDYTKKIISTFGKTTIHSTKK